MDDKKTKALEVKKQKQALSFAGASTLIGSPQTQKEVNERKVIVLAAKALAISPFGVNILGSLPYINNKGLKEKMSAYASEAFVEYDWVQYAKDDTEKAICKARVVKGSKPLCGWVVGECSPKTIKMGTLAGYQNHLAQTRAENRAMEAAFGTRIRKELFENIARLLGNKETDESTANKVMTAANTTAEEAVQMHADRPAPADTYAKAVNAVMQEKNPEKLAEFRKKIEGSKIYTAEQKAQLVGFITDRLEYAKENQHS